MYFFISDTHFRHDKEFIYAARGFASLNDMENKIIENWNECVGNEDDVYVLGDFFLGTDFEFIKDTINKLNGRIHLIIGNHDTDKKIGLYRTIPNIVEIAYALQIKVDKKVFYLSHYPTITTNIDCNPHNVIYNLFGHTHSKEILYNDNKYMYNVSCDAHNCCPVAIFEIFDDIEELEKYNTILP